MLRHREGKRLAVWLGQVRASHIPELQRFVQSIQREKDAVLAGLDFPVEQWRRRGKNQPIKARSARMMDGRAEFPLLRQRVLYAL